MRMKMQMTPCAERFYHSAKSTGLKRLCTGQFAVDRAVGAGQAPMHTLIMIGLSLVSS